ncbi:MAG: aldose epimerase family protein [Bacteroidota bacterium]|nr:aldose epimerase family protein [Bacteroidota bacterium]
MGTIRSLTVSSFLLGAVLSGCNQSPEKNKEIVVMENGNRKVFGTLDKDTVYSYTLQNGKGLKAVISNYGGTLLELWTPDRSGKTGDVILGFDSLEGYLQKGNPYFGALVGRYANRIGNARFSIDGKLYTLAANNNGNTLHGGIKGFDKVIWTVDQVNDSSLALSYTSPDGEEGFPGTMTVKVVYTVTGDNGLKIDYTAVSDKKTPVNLTNHAYFNLSAGNDSTVLQQELTLHASHYTPVNDSLIPTGKIASVKNTPMDFLKPKKVGRDIADVKGGYDLNFVIDKPDSGIALAASVYDEGSGRHMQVWTTQPGVQFYTGNFLDGSLTGRDGKKIVQHGALCLETQHYPDSPNEPSFPNVILGPGQTFHETTVYKFSVK